MIWQILLSVLININCQINGFKSLQSLLNSEITLNSSLINYIYIFWVCIIVYFNDLTDIIKCYQILHIKILQEPLLPSSGHLAQPQSGLVTSSPAAAALCLCMWNAGQAELTAQTALHIKLTTPACIGLTCSVCTVHFLLQLYTVLTHVHMCQNVLKRANSSEFMPLVWSH